MKNFLIIRLCVLLALALAATTLAGADVLTVNVSTQRYLAPDGNTVIHLDYEIPYKSLVFLAYKGGYFAQTEVTVEVAQGDSVVYTQTITDNIGVSHKADAASDKTYLNRVSYLLDGQEYVFRLQARDVSSLKQFFWVHNFSGLAPDSQISDLELCSIVRPDSTSYLEKFHRGGILYRTQPDLIFDKNEVEHVNLYFEVYTTPETRQETGLLMLTVERDSVAVSDDYIDFTPLQNTDGINLKIPIGDLAPGRYDGTLSLQLGDRSSQREFVFFVTEPKIPQYLLFPSPDDDYKLLRYFGGVRSSSDWRNYDETTKRKYVSQMWKEWADLNRLPPQNAVELLQERVDYSNKYYGHFDQGWTTDMGRIHIRRGKPDEIDKETTSDETRYVRKDYQIWKYRGGASAVYLFVDIQMNGNYKLLYVDGDEMETSNPDFQRYVGEDFDTSLLSN